MDYGFSHEHHAGDRALISAIVNNAIVDGSSVKRPRHPSLRNNKKDRHFIFEQKSMKMACCLLLLKLLKAKRSKYFKSILFSIFDSIEILKSPDRERIAYDARRFIDPNNKLFCFYTELLDLEPVALAKAVHRYFKLIDEGKVKLKIMIDNAQHLA